MTISIRLFVIVAVNVVVTILLAGIGFYGVRTLATDEMRIARSGEILHHHMISDMMHDGLRGDVYGAILSGSKNPGAPAREDILQDVKDHGETIQSAIAENRKLVTDPEERKLIEEAVPALNAYVAAASQLVQVALDSPEKLDQQKMEQFVAAFSNLETRLEAIGEQLEGDATSISKTGIETAAATQQWMIVFLVVGAGISTALSWYFSRSITSSLVAIIGNLSERGATTQRMNETLDQLSHTVAASSTEQAAAVQESVASMAEMSSMISQTVEGAGKSLEAAQQASERTQDGSKVMTEMMSSMESIQQANQQLREMAAIIKEIGVKTAVINDIVFKTQLLAFNASIEAARAGQHGRGFAVVAEEVGNLAEMSGTAAKEIQALLDSSDKQVTNMVEITEQRVSQGITVSRQAMTSFSQIANDIATISAQVQGINDAMKEQEVGVQQTQTAMTQIDSAAQQTSSASVGVSKSVSELKNETRAVNQIINSLRELVFGLRAQNRYTPSVISEDMPTPAEAEEAIPTRRSTKKTDWSEQHPH